MNGLLVHRVKPDYDQCIKNRTLCDAIVEAVEDTVRALRNDEDQTLEEFAVHNLNDFPQKSSSPHSSTVIL